MNFALKYDGPVYIVSVPMNSIKGSLIEKQISLEKISTIYVSKKFFEIDTKNMIKV